MDQDLLAQGIRNIQDAHFIRDHFVSIAFVHGYWNLVIAESQRAVELTCRGMICLMGHTPKKHHSIIGHVRSLKSYLEKTNPDDSLPFLKGIYMPDGYSIGIRFQKNQIQLIEYLEGRQSVVGTAAGWELFDVDQKAIRFETDMSSVRIFHEKTLLILYCYPKPEPQRLSITGMFTVWSDTYRLRNLKKVGERLSKTRNRAVYSEERYTREDALQAIDNMNTVFDASRGMFNTD